MWIFGAQPTPRTDVKKLRNPTSLTSISAIISISTIINSNSTIIRIIDSYRAKRDLCR